MSGVKESQSESLTNGKESAGRKEMRGRERIDRIDQSRDSSYTKAGPLEIRRRKRSKYEEKNETARGRERYRVAGGD